MDGWNLGRGYAGMWMWMGVSVGAAAFCLHGACSPVLSCPVARVQRSRSSRHFLGADRAFYYSFAPRQFSLILLVRLIPVALD